MQLGNDEVREAAMEARLVLTDLELERAVKFINNFLSMLDRFKELDLKDVESFRFAEPARCPLREDEVLPFPNVEEMLAESEHRSGALIRVPRIMGE
ncbi:MAG: hypothetical protein GX256_07175 [Fretibacterium sp.]|nr:hypothetical protein [Fretibacterium sp.]